MAVRENKKSIRETVIRLVLLLVGLTIAHLGVTLFLLADLGSDPFNVLVQGIYRSLSGTAGGGFLTHGRTHMAVCFLIILVLLAVDRSYIKIGTIVCMFCGGPIIDLFTVILDGIFNSGCFLGIRVAGLVCGCVILSFGMTIVMKSDAGVGPNDLVGVVISEKLHRPFSVVRVLVDLSFLAAGFLLGGAVGAGTVICVGIVGPVAGIFLPYSERIVKCFLKWMYA